MKIAFSILSMAFLLASCSNAENAVLHEEPVLQQTLKADTTPRVTGIGGVFFLSENPDKSREWYAQNLGMETDEYGAVFEFRNGINPDEINYLRWSTFGKNSPYIEPSKKEFMINYRVQNIEGMVRNLKANGVQVLGEIESYPYGKFVHLLDHEGNKVELWEPVDSVLTQMGGKTNK
jgi:predicted enzyme related to lactoylglutathione lyase